MDVCEWNEGDIVQVQTQRGFSMSEVRTVNLILSLFPHSDCSFWLRSRFILLKSLKDWLVVYSFI